jgi:hypothetical protein
MIRSENADIRIDGAEAPEDPDCDGAPGTPGAAPSPPDKPETCKQGWFDTTCHPSKDGDAGAPAPINVGNGRPGGHGQKAPPFTLNVDTIHGSVTIVSKGGNGARGGNGGKGGAGGDGQDAQQMTEKCAKACLVGDPPKCQPAKGGTGGSGSDGGNGANGGNGGDGGDIDVRYRTMQGHLLPFSPGGDPGSGGKAGDPGPAGQGGQCEVPPDWQPYRAGAGASGQGGSPGNGGASGNSGKVTVIPT